MLCNNGTCLILRLVGLVTLVCYVFSQETNTLRLAHVITRHGARSPTQSFPTDPYPADSWPQGYGQLSQLGIRQLYEFGEFLKDRYVGMRSYGQLMNESYVNTQIFVRANGRDRVIMSASSAVAGLYPPQGEQVWNPAIHWQPVPVHGYYPEPMLSIEETEATHSDMCPRFNKVIAKVFASKRYRQFVNESQDFFDEVGRYAGYNATPIHPLRFEAIADAVNCMKTNDMAVPSWVTDERYERMMYLYARNMYIYCDSLAALRFRSGLLIGDILKHAGLKISGKLENKPRLYAYFAHDTTITGLLSTFKMWNDQYVPLAASVLVELHELSPKNYTIKVFYRNDTSVPPFLMKIAGCETECPLDRFRELMEGIAIPTMEQFNVECQNDPPPSEQPEDSTALTVSVAVVVPVALILFVVIVLWAKSGSQRYDTLPVLDLTEST